MGIGSGSVEIALGDTNLTSQGGLQCIAIPVPLTPLLPIIVDVACLGFSSLHWCSSIGG